MSEGSVYLVHGIRMRSEIPLSAPPAEGAHDLSVRVGAPAPVPDEPPPGDLLAEVDEDGVRYTIAREGEDVRIRLPETVEFRVRGRDLTVHLDPSADPGITSVLLTGNVPAALLTARGECVIHASVVSFHESGLALVGGTGAGKSTLSALLCADGGRLVTEDVMRVRFDGDRVVSLPGLPEIRLRPSAASLAAAFPTELRGRSPDDRTTVRFPTAEAAPLVGVLLPVPSRDADRVESTRLTPAEALVELARYPRVLGWRTADVRVARFRVLARLARTVPVVAVRIPWGPPFPVGLAEALRAAARLEVEG